MTRTTNTDSPSDPRIERAKAHLEAGRFDQSVALLAQLTSLPEAENGVATLVAELGAALIAEQDKPRQPLLAALLEEPEAAAHVIASVADQGQADLALTLASRLSERRPEDSRTLLLRGWLLLDRGQIDEALNIGKGVAEHQPENVEALALRTDARIAQGDRAMSDGAPEAAKAAYSQALSDHDALLKRAPGITQFYLSRAQTYAKLDDTGAAIADCTRAIELDPEAVAAYNLRGVLHEQLGDYDAALADYEQVVRLLPEEPSGWRNRADARLALGEFEEARADYEQALKIAPTFAEARLGHARTQAALGLWDASLGDIAKVLEADAGSLEALGLRADVQVARGDQAVDGEDYDTAEEAYRAALNDYDSLAEAAPEVAQVFLNRGQTRAKLTDSEGAIADYTQAIELAPDAAVAYNLRGLLHEQLGDYEAALADYQQYVRLQPQDPNGWRNRADARLALGEVNEALVDYDQALKIAPAFVAARLGHARAQASLEHWQQALDDVATALESENDNLEALALRADIHAAQGDMAANAGSDGAAEQGYRKALIDYDMLVERVPDAPGPYLSRALTYAKLNAADAAVADYGRVIELDPESAAAYNGRGLVYEQQGDLEAALADYRKVVQLLPDDPVGWRNRGDSLLALGRFEEAVADYEQALRHSPEFVEARLGHARALAVLERWDEALGDIAEALKLDPDSLEALALQADIRAMQGDQATEEQAEDAAEKAYRAALAGYDALIERAPEMPTVYSSRAQTRLKLNDTNGAIADYSRAIELDPELATAFNWRGLLHEQQGDYDAALADYEQVVRLLPGDPVGWRNRADSRLALGRPEEARADYDQALKLLPEFVEARLGHGRSQATLGNWEQALEDVAKALRLDAENLEALGLQADIWAARGDEAAARGDAESAETAYRKSIAACDVAAELASDNAAIFLTRAWNWARIEEFDQSLADCERALALDAELADAHHLKGLLEEARGDEESALEEYERFIELDPEVPEGYIRRANVRINREQYHLAVWDFNRALERAPDNAEAYLGRANARLGLYYAYTENGLYAKAQESAVDALHDCDRALELGVIPGVDLHYRRGLILFALENFDASAQEFDHALDLERHQDPDTRISVLLAKAEALIGWGTQLQLDARLKAAVSALAEAIELTAEPVQLSQLYETMGRAWLELRDYGEAGKAFARAHAYSPENPWPFLGRAKAAYFANDLDTAREDFEALLAGYSDRRAAMLARVGLGLIFERKAQPEDATQAYAQALVDPREMRSYLDRYEFFTEFRAFEHAERDLRTAIELDPESPEALNLLAWVATEYAASEERLRESVGLARKSVELEGQGIERANYLDTLGWVLHLLNRDEEAIPHLREALALVNHDLQIRYHESVVEEALMAPG